MGRRIGVQKMEKQSRHLYGIETKHRVGARLGPLRTGAISGAFKCF